MADLEPGTPQDNQTSPDPATEGEGPKKFAGKFESIEELEKSYQELEKSRTKDRMEFGEINEKVGRMESALEQFAYSNQSRQAYQPAAPHIDPADLNQAELTRFYANPTGYKRELINEAKSEFRQEMQVNQSYVNTINDWSRDNPDLAPHAPIVRHFVEQTDGRLNPRRRLELAAVEARKYLLELKGHRDDPNPSPRDRIEAPGGAGAAPRTSSPQASTTPSRETELKAYVAQRREQSKPAMPAHQK